MKKDVTPIKPTFKYNVMLCMQTLTNFPFIEDDFDAITNYELLCKVVEYLNKVIDNDNKQNDAITSLYNAFVELKNYVDEFFDDLNIQNEVNNKLDAMAESGELAEIINEEIFTELNNKVNQNTESISNINSSITEINTSITEIEDVVDELDGNVDTIIEKLREDNYNDYHVLPYNTTNSFFNRINIYESADKQNYKYYVDEEELKNSGGTTIYVDRSFTGSSDGSASAPYKTIFTGIEHCSDGDTLYIKKGIYRREEITGKNQVIPSINIICDSGTIITASSELTWTQNATYSNVYQATRSNSTSVVDVRDNNLPVGLIKKSSLLECSQRIGSYYTDNAIVYVNIGETVTNDKVVVNLAIGDQQQLNFTPKANKNLKVYLENMTVLNGDTNIVKASNTTNYSSTLHCKNCKFMFNTSSTTDGINYLGANGVLINCEASYNKKDGFNYHLANGTPCRIIEIGCKGSCNGINNNDKLSNGSTIHDGGEIIRINGNYFRNNGSNVADVNTGTISVNIQCNAFDSLANTEDAYDTDFCTQQVGATMFLYNCIAKGNSYRNIFAVADSTIYVSNSKYDTTGGTGNIIIE